VDLALLPLQGSLNYGSIDDPVLDDLLVKQRAETNPDAQKDLWMQFWDRIHDMVYQAWFPEPLIRTAWHNYVLNFRYHGMVGRTCATRDAGATARR
jgi:hypothetical protein